MANRGTGESASIPAFLQQRGDLRAGNFIHRFFQSRRDIEMKKQIFGYERSIFEESAGPLNGSNEFQGTSLSASIGSVVRMGLATKKDQAESIVARHHPVGASTGYMQSLRGDWKAQVAEAWSFSSFAIELSALSEEELPSLAEYLRQTPSLPFRYISIHGPSKGRQMDEERLIRALRGVASCADAVVMHPDTIEDLELYRPLGKKLLLENMDARKADGRTLEELESAFAELPEAGFCFDIAHAWSIDPNMSVANSLLDGLGKRLRHVHLSSLSKDLHHVSLTAEDEEIFHPVLRRCLDVPWIFEAPQSSA